MATVIHSQNLQLLRAHSPRKPPPPPSLPPGASSRSLVKLKPHQNQLFSSKKVIQHKYPYSPSPIDPSDSSSTINGFGISSDKLSSLLRHSIQYKDAELARAVHAQVLKIENDIRLGNALISAYLKLGLVQDASRVFKNLSCPDVASYSALISGFSKSNRENEAVRLFVEMMDAGVEPNEYSFVAILTLCLRVLDWKLGFQVHALVIKTGCLDSVFVVNNLMGLYGKFSGSESVLKLFDEMPERDIASWNTLISSLVKELMYEKAFDLFRKMQQTDGFSVDYFTVSALLTACAGNDALLQGKEIHAHAIKIGLGANLSVNNALIGFYTICGSLKDVVALFERMVLRDVITWTKMITAYMEFGSVDLAVETFEKMPEKNCVSYDALLAGFCNNDEGLKALKFFIGMVEEGLELTDFTLSSVANACSLLGQKDISKQIHGFCAKFGFGSNTYIEAALFDMYTKCGRMADAEQMFHKWPSEQYSVIASTAILSGYARNGQPEEAISFFCNYINSVDEITLASAISVCGTLGFSRMGQGIHARSITSGYGSDLGVSNSLISMYARCGNMIDAIKVFSAMPAQDVVSWSALIFNHLLYRQGDEALAVWSKMKEAGIKPDAIALGFVISAYSHTDSNKVEDCRRLFASMKVEYDIEPTSEHHAAFIRVLGKWGFLEEAEEMILNMPFEPEVSVWRALLDSCRIHLNTEMGKRVAKKILAMEPRDPSTYILVSNLYSASGRFRCSDMVREDMRENRMFKHPGRSWIIHQKKPHSFYARDQSHPQTEVIYTWLQALISECLKIGYIPDTSFVLHDVEEHQKEDFLFYHSAKLAVTFGLLMSRSKEPVRVVKNIVLCGDCHSFFKYVSVVTDREVVLRDASGFHCFSKGMCSCRDCW